MTIDRIEGWLIKYGKIWPDKMTIIERDAFDNSKVQKIPITTSFTDHENVIGYCDLQYKKTGVYYIFHPIKSELADKVLNSWSADNYIGVYLNHVGFATKKRKSNIKRVNQARIVCGAICAGKYNSAYTKKVIFNMSEV